RGEARRVGVGTADRQVVPVLRPLGADVVPVAEQALVAGGELRQRFVDVVAAPRRGINGLGLLPLPTERIATKNTKTHKNKKRPASACMPQPCHPGIPFLWFFVFFVANPSIFGPDPAEGGVFALAALVVVHHLELAQGVRRQGL